MRRLSRMLRPYRGCDRRSSSSCCIAQAGALLAGPALVRYGIDHGLGDDDAGALNHGGRAVPRRSRSPRLFLGRLAILLVARVGEAFLRDLRKRLFDHLMSLSLDFFEREKTGKLVARMTSDIDAMQELVSEGPRAVRAEHLPVRRRGHRDRRCMSWQLALGVLVIVPPVYFAQPLVPPGVEQGVPRGARAHRPRT